MTGVLTSRTNPRIKLLRAAFEGRRRLAEGAVGIEGPHLIAEALRSGLSLSSIFVREDARRVLDELELPQGLEILILSRDAFDHAVVTENSQGVAALMVPHEISLPPGRDALLLVLEAIQDPGNMGTLIRSAEAFGAAGIMAMPGTVDPWNQKAIRASAGSVFRVPVVACTQEMLRQLQAEGVRLIAAVAREGIAPEKAKMSGGCAVMIGNEGAGLSEQLVRMADERITIPCPGAVESLNAAVAGSLLLYAASLQRAGGR